MGSITDVQGVRVGHYTDLNGITGCTVVLCEGGAVGGVSVRGAAPGTRETDLMRPGRLVHRVQAILLSGGSAFGLQAAGGVMQFLEEQGIGFPTLAGPVPIVPAAILYDLGIGEATARPDAAAGYAACQAASAGPIKEGSAGAGTGATVGKVLGPAGAMKGGIGTASVHSVGGITVGALAVVNSYGDVVDPTGRVLAGTRDPSGNRFPGSAALLQQGAWRRRSLGVGGTPVNTTLAVVATDAALTKEDTNWLAEASQDAVAIAIRPGHTGVDGDTVFALSLGNPDTHTPYTERDPLLLTAIASASVSALAEAISRAVLLASSLGGVPARGDILYDTI